MDRRAIGIFDSGLGGLTAVKQLMRVLPSEDIVYFGDTGRVPYGTRSEGTIIKYVKQDINFLETFNIKMIVAACGTASTVALPQIKDTFDTAIVGVVSAAAEAAASSSKNGKIGVIATPATIKSDAFGKEIHSIRDDVSVYSNACPLFVPLVENGYADSEAARLIASDYLSPLKEQGIDTLILGCTHYPLLKNVISSVLEDKVTLIDVGEQIALKVRSYLEKNSMLSEDHTPVYSYYVSDPTDNFAKIGGMFLQSEIKEMVKQIDIEKY